MWSPWKAIENRLLLYNVNFGIYSADVIQVRYFSEWILPLYAIFELHELHKHVGQAGRSLHLLSWLHRVTSSSKAEKVGLVFADGLQRLVFLKSGKGLVGQLGNGCQRLEIPVRRTTVKRFHDRKQVFKVFFTLRRRQEPWSSMSQW